MNQVNAPVIGAVLFDLDGTLLDTAPDFVTTLTLLAAEMSCPAPEARAIHQTVSSGARALLKLMTGMEEDHPDFAPALQRLLDLYGEQVALTRARLYPGIAELLSALTADGIPWGIVTNKPERFSTVLLKQLGLEHQCSVLVCPEHVSRSKPDPEPLLLASEKLAVPAAQCIYAGDHPRDIEAARAAGMFSIAAGYGYLPVAPPVSSWGADHIVHSGAEMRAWVDLARNPQQIHKHDDRN